MSGLHDDDLIRRGDGRRYYGRLYGFVCGLGGLGLGFGIAVLLYRYLLVQCLVAL